jgi:hypothetical protein
MGHESWQLQSTVSSRLHRGSSNCSIGSKIAADLDMLGARVAGSSLNCCISEGGTIYINKERAQYNLLVLRFGHFITKGREIQAGMRSLITIGLGPIKRNRPGQAFGIMYGIAILGFRGISQR